MTRVSLGVAGSLGPDLIARIAPAAQRAGFHALWVNDTPQGDSLAALEAAAAVTDTLVLATGVVPMDRRPPATLTDALRRLPEQRLVLGVGSGAMRAGALAMVHEAVTQLRDLTTARVLVGALGPRMRRLAAQVGDGPLLSWLTPQVAERQAGEERDVAASAWVALYVRAALEPAALPRLQDETARYAGYPKYAANFARLQLAASDTVLAPASVVAGLAHYTAAVDEVVLRAITPGDGLADYLRFIAQAEPLLASD